MIETKLDYCHNDYKTKRIDVFPICIFILYDIDDFSIIF